MAFRNPPEGAVYLMWTAAERGARPEGSTEMGKPALMVPQIWGMAKAAAREARR
jgi:hypothetical protein